MNNLMTGLSLAAVATTVLISFPPDAQAFSLYDESSDGALSNEGLTPTQLGSLTLGANFLTSTFYQGANDYFTFTVPKGQVLTEIVLNSWKASPNFEDIAFIAIEKGDAFKFKFTGTLTDEPAKGLLGWSHLRSPQIGTNKILTEMGLSNLDPISSGLDILAKEEADNNPYTPEQIADLPMGGTPEEIETLKKNLRQVGVIGTPGEKVGWFPGATGFTLPLGPGDYSIWLRQGSPTEITVELGFNTQKTPEPSSVCATIMALGLAAVTRKRKSKP